MNNSVNANDSFKGNATVHNGVWSKNHLKWLRHEVSQLKANTRYPHKFENHNKKFPYEPEEMVETNTRFIAIKEHHAIHSTVINTIWNHSIELKGIQPREMYLQQNIGPLGLYRHKGHHNTSESKCYLMPINTKESKDKTLIFSETVYHRPHNQTVEHINTFPKGMTEENNSFKYNIAHTVKHRDNEMYSPLDNLKIDKVYDHVPGTMLEISWDRLMASTFFKSGNAKDYILTIFYLRDIQDNF